jgi:hypothetical protein
MAIMPSLDEGLRTLAFSFLSQICGTPGQLISRKDLIDGVVVDGQYVPFALPRGISTWTITSWRLTSAARRLGVGSS